MVLDLFKSSLFNRKHCVRIGGSFSEFLTRNMGVPKGYVLGPILFNIFINDISTTSSKVKTTLYADDTTLLFRNSS